MIESEIYWGVFQVSSSAQMPNIYEHFTMPVGKVVTPDLIFVTVLTNKKGANQNG